MSDGSGIDIDLFPWGLLLICLAIIAWIFKTGYRLKT